jgi:hypothetical protein
MSTGHPVDHFRHGVAVGLICMPYADWAERWGLTMPQQDILNGCPMYRTAPLWLPSDIVMAREALISQLREPDLLAFLTAGSESEARRNSESIQSFAYDVGFYLGVRPYHSGIRWTDSREDFQLPASGQMFSEVADDSYANQVELHCPCTAEYAALIYSRKPCVHVEINTPDGEHIWSDIAPVTVTVADVIEAYQHCGDELETDDPVVTVEPLLSDESVRS